MRTTDVLEVDGQPAVRAIADAMAAAHGAGVVHGDLTPRSVLVPSSPSPPSLPARVVDLGLAVALQDPGGPKSRTHSGMPMGSPAYQAPEQLRDARDIDARTDVFALGCLLFELVSGARAFPGGFGDVVAAIAAGRHAPIDPSVPTGIREVITACLQVDRTARPHDARDVLARLDAETAPASPPTFEGPAASSPAPAPTAQTPPASVPASRSVDGRPLRAALALALVAVIGGSGLGLVGLAGRGDDSRPPPARCGWSTSTATCERILHERRTAGPRMPPWCAS